MHAPRSAERDDRQVARIDASLDGDHPQRADHLRLGDGDDAGGGLDGLEAEHGGELRRARARRAPAQHDLAAERLAVAQVAEKQVGVGDA